MTRKESTTRLFVERLTCSNFILTILPQLITLRQRHQREKIIVGYIDAASMALKFARLLLTRVAIGLEKINFKLIDLRDDKGDLLCLIIGYDDLAEIQQRITNKAVFKAVAADPWVKNSAALFYLKKASIVFVYQDSDTLWRLSVLIHLAALHRKQQAGLNGEHVLFANQRAWMDVLVKYAAKQGVMLCSLGKSKFDLKKSLKQGIGDARLQYIQRLFYGSPQLKADEKAGEKSPKLVLEYYGLFNLDQPQFYSNFTFLQQSDFPAQDIVLTSNFTSTPISEEQYKAMQARGIRAVALNPKAASAKDILVFCRFKQEPAPRLAVDYNHRKSLEYQWIKNRLTEFHRVERYYHSLFKTVGGKIYLSWFKYDARHAAIAQAISNCGGVMVLYQRANEEVPNAETATYCDVFFGFNKDGAAVERQSGSRIPYYVVTGYLGDHRFDLLKDPAKLLRQQLQAAGAAKIITFFDENSGDDARWHTGHEFMRHNYEFLLTKLLSTPQMGLILKPKMHSTLRKRLGPIAELLEQALKTKRCYLYENRGLYNHYPPVIAALSSDIAIHGHLCAATAGVESALAGVPTLLLDREGWSGNPLYRLKEGKIIFKNWNDLWEACGRHWQKPIDGFGDWSPYLKEFDPFCDGKASQRMGTYLSWLLEGFKQCKPREQVLREAADRYRARWGEDKIISVGQEYA